MQLSDLERLLIERAYSPLRARLIISRPDYFSFQVTRVNTELIREFLEKKDSNWLSRYIKMQKKKRSRPYNEDLLIQKILDLKLVQDIHDAKELIPELVRIQGRGREYVLKFDLFGMYLNFERCFNYRFEVIERKGVGNLYFAVRS